MSETVELPQDQMAPTEVPPSARLMLRVVYIMGIVLALLFLGLIGGIIWKATRAPLPKAAAAPAIVELGLARGATVQSMALDGDRLALNTGTEIIVVDLRKNAVISRMAINPK